MPRHSLCITLTLITSLALASLGARAESFRCGKKLVEIGDTKADVISLCGAPLLTDHYCEPVTSNLQIQAQQQGDNNIQNNIAIQACQDVDIWTYQLDKGQLTRHLYFSAGKLRHIEVGGRVD